MPDLTPDEVLRDIDAGVTGGPWAVSLDDCPGWIRLRSSDNDLAEIAEFQRGDTLPSGDEDPDAGDDERAVTAQRLRDLRWIAAARTLVPDLARQLLEAREALRATWLDMSGDDEMRYEEVLRDNDHHFRACLPEHREGA